MGEFIMDTQGEDNNLSAVFIAEKRTNTFIPLLLWRKYKELKGWKTLNFISTYSIANSVIF